jgi:hypothetical protein
MSQILIRGIDPQVKEAIARKARKRGTSVEAEARLALEQATRTRSWIEGWIENTRRFRGSFDLPERSIPRALDL